MKSHFSTAQAKTGMAAANSAGPGAKQLRARPALGAAAHKPVQMVLRRATDARREAELIAEYHTAETVGDACVAAGDYESAIPEYNAAATKRRTANSFHVAADQGHIDAIKVVEGKAATCRTALRQIVQVAENRRRQAAALAARDAPRVPVAAETMGEPHLASFLPGNQSAWQPRPKAR